MPSTANTSPDDLLFDAWTPASFKRVLGNRTFSQSWLAPTWVGEHQRRLGAYKLLISYADNVSRLFLQEPDPDRKANHREYGDAAVVVEQILSALIGETQTISTEGAPNAAPEDVKTTPDVPDAPPADPQAAKAWKLQSWFRQWAKDERLPIKMIENERNAIAMGDGVYTLGIDPDKGRVRLRVFDPGFYFPVLGDGNEDEFPERVHVAWEVPQAENSEIMQIRRLTWELLRVTPWTPAGKTKQSKVECFFSDGTWTVNKGGRQTVDDFAEASVKWTTFTDEQGDEIPMDHIPMGVDEIPVIHIPNTVALLNHYGRSSLMTVLQILDDIANADTDLQAASATTGSPPIVLSGSNLGGASPTYRPGQVWEVGKDGNLAVLDTSKSLDALLKYIDALLSRLSINVRLPESVLGRVKPSEVPSGIALALSFGPMVSMINQMRMVRTEKYRLLLKMVWRMSLAGNFDDVPQEWVETGIDFGPFLPADKQAAVDMVVKLMNKDNRAISLETAVKLLMIAGVPIDDALMEVALITERDFTGAVELFAATSDAEAVFKYLRIQESQASKDLRSATLDAKQNPPPVVPQPVAAAQGNLGGPQGNQGNQGAQ